MMTATQVHEYVQRRAEKRQENTYKRKYPSNKLTVAIRLKPKHMDKILESGMTKSDFIRKAIEAYTIGV